MVPNPPKSDDHSTTMLPINERTPLTNSQVCCDSSLEASRQSIRYGGDNPLQDISESSNKSYQSYQGSIDSVRDHLVKAHTRLSDLIQYHTGSYWTRFLFIDTQSVVPYIIHLSKISCFFFVLYLENEIGN